MPPGIPGNDFCRTGGVHGGKTVVARLSLMLVENGIHKGGFPHGFAHAIYSVPRIARAGERAKVRTKGLEGAQDFMRTRGIAADMVRQTTGRHIEQAGGYGLMVALTLAQRILKQAVQVMQGTATV